MESGRKSFCFSNPRFCQANTGILLKMAAVEEWISARYGNSHTTLNPGALHKHALGPLWFRDVGNFFFSATKMLNRKPFQDPCHRE
jgi:hypothetical protein